MVMCTIKRITMERTMKTHSFSLVISLPNVDDETAADLLFESGCDDSLFGKSCGVYEIDFDREADSFSEAVLSAIKDVHTSGIGSKVIRVLPDDLVNANTLADTAFKNLYLTRALL